MPWYDHGFARCFHDLKQAFRDAITTHAWKVLEESRSDHAVKPRVPLAIGMLAYLREHRLVDWLLTKVQSGRLSAGEHRALIHMNTDAAIQVYLKSCSHYRTAMAAIDKSEDQTGSDRASLWYQVVLKQGDITAFPHDALTRAVKKALLGPDREDMSFGIDWAETLQCVELVDDYANAVAALRKMDYFVRAEMIRNIVAGLDGAGIVDLFNTAQSVEARKAILRSAGGTYHLDVENLLIDALSNDELLWDASVGLGSMRSRRAGPLLHQRLATVTGVQSRVVVKALGRIRYEPARGDLIARLDALVAGLDTNEHDSEWEIIGALGSIGGVDAYDRLAERFAERPCEQILSYLLDSHDEHALRLVRQLLLDQPDTKHLLGWALLHRDMLHDDVVYFDREPKRPEYTDETILAALLESVAETIAKWERNPTAASEAMSRRTRDYEAVAYFDLKRAREFLQDLAERPLDSSGRSPRSELDYAISFARGHLAALGNVVWAKEMIECELRRAAEARFFSSHRIEELMRWPEDLVREALLRRIRQNDKHADRWVDLFLHFARADDAAVLRDCMEKVSDELADAIKLRLGFTSDVQVSHESGAPTLSIVRTA